MNIGALFVTLAAISGVLAVAMGAFAAHGLQDSLSPHHNSILQTANNYHFYHTLALLALGILALQWGTTRSIVLAGGLFTVGILLFCGSLYLLALGAPRWFGAITPIGGTAWLIAWAMTAYIGWRAI